MCLHLPLMKRRWHKAIRFLFIHLRHIPCGDALAAVGAEDCTVILREVDRAFDDAVVVHLDEVTLADFLVVRNPLATIRAAYGEDVTAADFFAVWVWVSFHVSIVP